MREVEEALAIECASRGMSTNEIVGFLVAEHLHGVLKDGCPAWIRNTIFKEIQLGTFNPNAPLTTMRVRVLSHIATGFEEGELEEVAPEC